MFYEEKFKIGLKDIGKENRVKNKAILEMLENIGAFQSDLIGYGINDVLKNKVTWILLDWKLKIIDRPKYDQEIKIKTWARYANKFFTYRDYELYVDSKLVAIATSKWALVNVETGKMAGISQKVLDAYQVEEKHVFEEKNMDKIKAPDNYESSIKYTVIRKDIDVNKHLHNLYYLDLAYEALPEEVYEQERPFDNVRIMYKKEVKLGEQVECQYTKQGQKHIVTIKNKDNTKIHSVIELY